MTRDANARKLMKTIERVLKVQQTEMIPTFQEHAETLQYHEQDLDRLFDLLEMYVYIFLRMHADAEGIRAQNRPSPDERAQHLLDRLNYLQEYYMACVSIAGFLEHVGAQSEEIQTTPNEEE